MKAANIYKLGEGPINYDWNQRYFVLIPEKKELTYFNSENDTERVNTYDLSGGRDLVLISSLTEIEGREHSI